MGPSFEFKDYIDFIHLRNDYNSLQRKNAMKAGFIEFVKAITNIAINFFLSSTFNLYYCSSSEFGKKNAIYQVYNIFHNI